MAVSRSSIARELAGIEVELLRGRRAARARPRRAGCAPARAARRSRRAPDRAPLRVREARRRAPTAAAVSASSPLDELVLGRRRPPRSAPPRARAATAPRAASAHSSAVDAQRRELALPRLEELALRRRSLRARPPRRRGARRPRASRAMPPRPRAASVVKPPNASTSIALLLRRRQRLVRVLAVQVDQHLADRRELRQRRRPAVDPGAAAALRVEHAPQQQRAVVAGEALVGEPGARAPGASSTSNAAASSARSAPGRSWRSSKRSPSSSASASSRIDLPAPVSPVSTVKPGSSSRSSASTTTKLRIESRRSIGRRDGARVSAGASGDAQPLGVSLQCSFSRSIAKWSCPSGCSRRAG